MGFTLSSVATTGLPPGQYVLRIEDIEAGVAVSKKSKLQFTGSVAHSDNPDVKTGQKEVWSYTYARENINIVANDLVRAGLPKDLIIEGDATLDAKTYATHMRGNHYVVSVTAQKKDPTRTNTSFVGPYHANGLSAHSPTTPAYTPPQAVGATPTIPFAQHSNPQGAWPPQPAQQTGAAGWGAPQPAQAPNSFNPNAPFPHSLTNALPAAPFINPAPTQQEAWAAQSQLAQHGVTGPAAAPQTTGLVQSGPGPTPQQEVGLNTTIIQALQQGERPPLNGKQLEQIRQAGWTAIYDEYAARAAQAMISPTAPPYNPATADPNAVMRAAFGTV